jgi:hypothetical protein
MYVVRTKNFVWIAIPAAQKLPAAAETSKMRNAIRDIIDSVRAAVPYRPE